MNPTADLARLEARHGQLEQMIDSEFHRPMPEQGHLTELKREKLKIKEEIAVLQGDLQTA
ncbi:MAG: YdcH family protein [Proteobacteria bacterium]|nr:YdcH family protein [Pseudomonadota bacterium]